MMNCTLCDHFGLALNRYYILPDSLNLDTLLVDLDQAKIRPKRPERVGQAGGHHIADLPADSG